MQYRGVNLGGWLVLERWITPSVFTGTSARDEKVLCEQLGARKTEVLRRHREAFISEADIAWIAEQGLNALRLPVPYWLFGDHEPFVPCDDCIDWLIEQAGKHGLAVVLDVHAVPGSQNGWDHSGVSGPINWLQPQNRESALAFIERLVLRYGDCGAVKAIELVNEPHPDTDLQELLHFYQQAIEIVRAVNPDIQVMVSDGFRPNAWRDTTLPQLENVLLDMHLYQAFDEADKKLSMQRHIKKAQIDWQTQIVTVQKDIPVVVGEWSLGLDPRAFRGLDAFERDKALQAYAAAQTSTFDLARGGWFFWTYKTEDGGGWSYRDCVTRGWLPRLDHNLISTGNDTMAA